MTSRLWSKRVDLVKYFLLDSLLTFEFTSECTEVGRAFLIHFQKLFLNKVFIRIKIARKFKFYAGMVTSGSKSVKKCQKMLKKATIWTYTKFF